MNNRIKIVCSKVEENSWSGEHTNKVEKQSVQDGYKTGHVGPLEPRMTVAYIQSWYQEGLSKSRKLEVGASKGVTP